MSPTLVPDQLQQEIIVSGVVTEESEPGEHDFKDDENQFLLTASSSSNPHQNHNNNFKDQNKLYLFKKSLKIIPLFFAHTCASVASFVAMQPLLMEIACKDDLNFTDNICGILTLETNITIKEQYKDEETQLQIRMAHLMFWKSILQNVFPMILVLFIGGWSDIYGRKIPMILLVAASILQNVILILCDSFRSAWWASSWCIVLGTTLISGFVGGDPSFVMAVFNYITDTSSIDERTFLNGVAMGYLFIGVAFGYTIGGLFSSTLLNYTQTFLVTNLIEALILIYIIFFLGDIKSNKISSFKAMIKSFLNFNLLWNTFYTIGKGRVGNTRLALFLLLFTHICVQATWMGELPVLFIFAKYKFNWDAGDYGVFTSARYIVGFIGNWIAVTLFSKMLKLSDASIGICSCVSAVISYAIFALAPNTLWMYIGISLALFISTMQVIPRSIMSKIVPSNEIGSVSSFLAVFDCIIGMSAGPAYSYLYSNTLNSFTSAFLAVSGLLTIPGIFIYIWFLRNKRLIAL